MRAAVVATVVVLVGLSASCFLRTPVHRCDEGTDCTSGVCFVAAGADDGLCATVDEACGGGLRYADDAGDVAGACIEGVNPPDAGPEIDAGFVAYDSCLVGGPVPRQDTCTMMVCDAMPRCCTHEWSELCRMEAERRCTSRCGEVAAFGGGDNAVAGSGFLGVGRWNGSDFAQIWNADLTTELIGSIAWGDIDGDLRPELAACGDDPDGGNFVHIYHATGGDPAFTEFSGSPIPLDGHCYDLTWIDLDVDGDQDLLYGTFLGPEWIENDDGIFAQADDTFFPSDSMGQLYAIDAADLDDDGRLDIVLAPYDERLKVYRNTASGLVLMEPPVEKAAGNGHWESVRFGDVDRDGLLDILTSGDSAMRIIRNESTVGGFDEDGSLFTPTLPQDAEKSALIDADEDGDLDALVHAVDVAIRLFRNNGSGNPLFTQTPLWDSDPDGGIDPMFTNPDHLALALGDVDGDTHIDFVACGTPGPCQMWLGNGAGAFTGEWAPGGSTPYRGFALTGVWPGILPAPP